MGEEGLSDHLVLLSVQQTCKYRGVNFLKFLLSREEDVGTYCERKKNAPPAIEVYPPGFVPYFLAARRNPKARGEAESPPQ